LFWEKALKDKESVNDDSRESPLDPQKYTIFHALFEAMKEKDKKRKKK
jgi:hypothetical protein